MRWWPMPPGGPPSEELAGHIDDAVRDTIRRFEEAGSPVITDGEIEVKLRHLSYPMSASTTTSPRVPTAWCEG
jgi:5-methyltetrahydropteroyltriglutamate--homocysteine methyltransferase